MMQGHEPRHEDSIHHGKGRGTGSPLEPAEGTSPADP